MFDIGWCGAHPAPSAAVTAALDDARAAAVALRCAEARLLHAIDALDTLGAATETGHRSLERLLPELLHLDLRETRALLRDAALVTARPGLSGDPIEPTLPSTAMALDSGHIGRAHLQVIAAAMAQVARVPHLPVQVVDEIEAQLADLACRHSPRELATAAAEILLRVDPDGQLDDEPARPDQELQLSTGRDGGLRGRFRFADPDAAETIRTAIDALTPRSETDPDTGTHGRSLAERRASALHDMAADALGLVEPDALDLDSDPGDSDPGDSDPGDSDPGDPSPPDPTCPPTGSRATRGSWRPRTQGGDAVGLIVTVPLDVLEARVRDHAGHGLLDGRWALAPETARRLACDSVVIPAVLGSRGELLDLGRKTRVVSTAQRRALIARDRHCAHPGCRQRPRRCRAHHITPWSWGGATDLSNLVLLCGYHHHLVHHSGWTIHMRDGIPTFVPPAWLDPLRVPRTGSAQEARVAVLP